MRILITFVVVVLFSEIGVTRVVGQNPDQNNRHRLDVTAPPNEELNTAPASAVLAAFEKLKELVGEWEARDGVSYGGKPIRISYKIISNGTGVMETYSQVGVDMIEMVTVYHLDGDKLMLTHFCAVNNQVRLRAEPILEGGKELRFSYVDATNLPVSHQEVMNNLMITFQDRDHFTQTWTWRVTNDKGKTYDDKAVYNFVRRK